MDTLYYFEKDECEYVAEASSVEDAIQQISDRNDDEVGLTPADFVRSEEHPSFWDEFKKKYKPIPLVPRGSEYVHDSPPDEDYHKVRTVVEGDDGETMWVTTGFHVVNRMGYIVCRVAWKDEDEQEQYLY